LKFGAYVINIKKFLFQKFHGKRKFNPWKAIKVDNSEFFSQLHILVDFEYLFFGESFGLEI